MPGEMVRNIGKILLTKIRRESRLLDPRTFLQHTLRSMINPHPIADVTTIAILQRQINSTATVIAEISQREKNSIGKAWWSRAKDKRRSECIYF